MKGQAGFTLLELLIVVVLLAMMIPNLVATRALSKDVMAVTCSQSFKVAVELDAMFARDLTEVLDGVMSSPPRSCRGDALLRDVVVAGDRLNLTWCLALRHKSGSGAVYGVDGGTVTRPSVGYTWFVDDGGCTAGGALRPVENGAPW
ncbi:prepilin-type N-terminal cleavage/methylation domain-containing protein [Deinococcus soli (ex Cha et al. 2016)]|uniref:Prepilin-type N-terminal cleavage/methylation domain-containing protein n=2 Tax=Deinococcus soli (ex Cha et al. 2016) TaxID=1309411 RepID=A0ACC6KKY9_9DEIO|nr:prepilin-type N-terminal cleavage/methylation domain-containing protein [Deinococcus soli (ex Cha et al. 2016)]MDR6218668.1 prepilin-type N-terminal cleavage/methylation domain-containing protein [Deinococcus soli (ex Cha et al. 2016)]MDR6328465.1 prepilin-type N-terminal cleavage/methylation domain-containing protein [Deinococcus soli (ex Cha et al. 2016)]MDR6753076.1 prepilin-type N-terminal cleavage/methylation domain-containing protein [Deinococcus soli (ex Cha et al. 2016)]